MIFHMSDSLLAVLVPLESHSRSVVGYTCWYCIFFLFARWLAGLLTATQLPASDKYNALTHYHDGGLYCRALC